MEGGSEEIDVGPSSTLNTLDTWHCVGFEVMSVGRDAAYSGES
jgi:hypothetical protein